MHLVTVIENNHLRVLIIMFHHTPESLNRECIRTIFFSFSFCSYLTIKNKIDLDQKLFNPLQSFGYDTFLYTVQINNITCCYDSRQGIYSHIGNHKVITLKIYNENCKRVATHCSHEGLTHVWLKGMEKWDEHSFIHYLFILIFIHIHR